MIYDPESAVHLKPWLVRTLEPICDAEPGALADYILALLQHNVPENEMRQELAVQLDEFLEKECSSFIDTLFTVIRTKSYLPYNAAPPSPSSASKSLDTGIPIPLDVLLPQSQERTRKRSNTDDERDGRPPAKGPRLNQDGQFSRYGNGDGRMGLQSSGGWSRPQMDRFRDGGMGAGMAMYHGQMGGMGMNGMGGVNGRRPQGYQPPDQKRGICRDYHNNGYCARGAMCKYSHGVDAVVPGQLYPGAMPFMPIFQGTPGGMPFMQGAAYDPHEARMDMRPMRHHQRAPLLPRVQQEDGSRVVHPINASGELPVIQDLTPAIPPDVQPSEPIPQGDVNMEQTNTPPANLSQMAATYKSMLGLVNENGSVTQAGNQNMEVDFTVHTPGMRPPTLGRGHFRGGRGGGRGRGTFGGEVHSFRPEKRNDKTLVVEKIPEDSLSLESVNSWFKRFGTVTNVAIDAMSAKALVSFSSHDEAHAAWKSEDAVFGNRFVKVFWHRPMEGHGQVGARMLAASAPLVANMTAKSTSSTPQPTPVSTSPSTSTNVTSSSAPPPMPRKPAPGSSSTLSALAAKQQQLEQKIAEQKSLMASLETASAEEKKDIMVKLRRLGEEMTNLTSSSVSTSSTTASVAAVGAATKKPVDSLTEHEKRERERLDKELDKLNATDSQKGDTTEELKAKLEKLKAEAASLGLDSALPSTSAPYRGYRGRGRGGPGRYFRGAPMRGGPPRGSMKLDNRPKKLLVKGVSEDNSQALRDWYETTGQLESVEPAEGSGSYIVSFKSRSAAEMGLAKGANVPIVGTVQISWYTGKESTTNTTSTPPTKTSSSAAPVTAEAADEGSHRFPEGHHLQEEEIIASGWGGDDDEDGMGML
ncbi:hypothetical protein CPB84DRAFT_1837655 [Gymnopilus junonius]|uniref:C3H1-type domain-containing protein n=1 Tax=Gymnopilus junonius TaxID=109634 RepID=A0A9P5TJC7_GYMJU|nr:hypothetical protein CPB84DRAFT_1837655 [Gymnopilus junonius]